MRCSTLEVIHLSLIVETHFEINSRTLRIIIVSLRWVVDLYCSTLIVELHRWTLIIHQLIEMYVCKSWEINSFKNEFVIWWWDVELVCWSTLIVEFISLFNHSNCSSTLTVEWSSWLSEMSCWSLIIIELRRWTWVEFNHRSLLSSAVQLSKSFISHSSLKIISRSTLEHRSSLLLIISHSLTLERWEPTSLVGDESLTLEVSYQWWVSYHWWVVELINRYHHHRARVFSLNSQRMMNLNKLLYCW